MISLVAPSVYTPPAPALSAFTLSSALLWLGHDCGARRCSAQLESRGASLWFLRKGRQLVYPLSAVVVVEPFDDDGSLSTFLQLLARVDRCAGSDHISVRPRYGYRVRSTTSDVVDDRQSTS